VREASIAMGKTSGEGRERNMAGMSSGSVVVHTKVIKVGRRGMQLCGPDVGTGGWVRP
jgi:hypothetical protein